ncbi:RND family transporter [Isachenkonia alkalipeptolytica]|uniref:RND family transporter n=2 Tax=Isachenkonia alkalipeptolytica TaxID=2565777 RepID=A0AA43XM02_9CLOT|nr:RND family transporter [Isachenkonia alkalipeptolytica]
MTDYLPGDTQSTEAITVMEEEFAGDLPNARVLLNEVTLLEALEYKERIQNISGIRSVEWLDDVFGEDVLLTTPLAFFDASITDNYFRDQRALLELTVESGLESEAVGEIRELIGEENAVAGHAVNTAESQDMAFTEVFNALTILLPVILIILFIATSSWVEPFLYFITIGIAVLINMGTNLFIGEISFVTQTVSPILQLAVSLDYAIFLMHTFNDQKKTHEAKTAMINALRIVLPTIAASAATTIVGFSALMFMRFGIGSDLGLNLVKGISLSFLSVIFFLPALTLVAHGLIEKTKHRNFLPKFHKVGRGMVRIRIFFLIIALLVVIPSYFARSEVDFLYGTGDMAEGSRAGDDLERINQDFGTSNPLVLMIPKSQPGEEVTFTDELSALPHITGVVSYVTSVGPEIPRTFAPQEVTDQFYSDTYSRIILYLDLPAEGDRTFQVVNRILETADNAFDTYYLAGESASLLDMKEVIEADTRVVNLIAVAGIFLVILVTFKSLTIPLFLVLTIESAIWINLSFPYYTASPLSYVGYLIISTIQLGATVDYAILLTHNYLTDRKSLPKKEAMVKTLSENLVAILISAGILSFSGFILGLTSTNPIISELGILLGRGTFLSFSMVVLVLPALFLMFDRVIEKTTLKSDFYRNRKKEF